jgi:hypothetical protein
VKLVNNLSKAKSFAPFFPKKTAKVGGFQISGSSNLPHQPTQVKVNEIMKQKNQQNYTIHDHRLLIKQQSNDDSEVFIELRDACL